MSRVVREHELKCWPDPFEAIANGEKDWEFRQDDRGYRVGDALVLREWMPHIQAYTGRVLNARVIYILHAGFGLTPGHVIMSLDVTARRDVPMKFAVGFVAAFLLGVAFGLGYIR